VVGLYLLRAIYLDLLRAELVDNEKTKPKPNDTIYSLLRVIHLRKCLLRSNRHLPVVVKWK
jgi:hypothetical protein